MQESKDGGKEECKIKRKEGSPIDRKSHWEKSKRGHVLQNNKTEVSLGVPKKNLGFRYGLPTTTKHQSNI